MTIRNFGGDLSDDQVQFQQSSAGFISSGEMPSQEALPDGSWAFWKNESNNKFYIVYRRGEVLACAEMTP